MERTGKTQGIRFNKSPPRKANRSANPREVGGVLEAEGAVSVPVGSLALASAKNNTISAVGDDGCEETGTVSETSAFPGTQTSLHSSHVT